jgi:hypothetical protein
MKFIFSSILKCDFVHGKNAFPHLRRRTQVSFYNANYPKPVFIDFAENLFVSLIHQ